jgi:ferredoxin
MTGRRLAVDWPACKAHGVCAELLPEIVELDEWGYPVIAPGPVPESLRRYAQRAVSSCPTMALRLVPVREAPAAPSAGSAPSASAGSAEPVGTAGTASAHASARDVRTAEDSPRRRARRSS